MPSCELCGNDTDSTTKVKIEGATLQVCDSCSEMGKEVSPGKQKSSGSSSSGSSSRNEEVLVSDYGQKIKEARESEQLSIQELSDELDEKASLLSKLEKEDLKPDNPLAEKLSERLGVDLYTNPEVANYDAPSTDSGKATVQDVAEVKD